MNDLTGSINHNTLPPMHSNKERQRGFSLLESLVSIFILSLGMLGIVGIQLRTLADTQTGTSRAKAIQLIEDLSERIQANPSGLNNMATYLTTWTATPAAPVNCTALPCTSAQLATYDISNWKATVRRTLPLGNAAVFLSTDEPNANNRRQLGVMIAWRENERVRESDSATDTDAYKSIFTLSGTSTTACPAGMTCHMQYIMPSSRCTPDIYGGAGTFICP